ncbi:MAG: S1C family serine protease [bacterium]|nr:S1C family serine protease [bacterium]
MNKPLKKNYLVSFLALALLTGGAAGVVATVVTESYLNRYIVSLEVGTTPPRLGEERPRIVPSNYDESLNNVNENVLPVVVRWHRALAPTANIARGSYIDDNALGSGVVLSSDGWVLTAKGLFTEAQAISMIAVIDGRVYTVVDTAIDELTDSMLVKLDASNLPVVRFGDGIQVDLGDQVFVVLTGKKLVSTSVTEIADTRSFTTTAEALGTYLVLRDSVSRSALGAPVVNGAGELVGVMSSNPDGSSSPLSYARPLSSVMPVVRSVLRENVVSRPHIGLTVLSLEKAIGHDAFGQGALVIEVPRRDTPAADAEIRRNDILLELNGEVIGDPRSLGEILLDYRVGDIVTIHIKRDMEELDVSVQLDALL